jgi:hypothetical protein
VNQAALDALLRRFRRQLTAAHVLRVGLLAALGVSLIWAARSPAPGGGRMVFLVALAGAAIWIALLIKSMGLARRIQTGSTLLSLGQLDDAEVWLRQAMMCFSFSARSKIVACQQLASLFFRRDSYAEAIVLCRELLRHRLRGLRNVWINARLLLADSLLMLDEVAGAYEALGPVCNVSLSLAERMKLLPIRLRYELAADHAASCVQSLKEKVRIAELLDAPRAALVHALLAEACRRQAMPAQQAFLCERARLYHDLNELVERYPLIAPVVH